MLDANRAGGVSTATHSVVNGVHAIMKPKCIFDSPRECAVALVSTFPDQMGSQISHRLTVAEMAFRSGCAYLHTPLATSKSLSQQLAKRIEHFFGFGRGCPVADAHNRSRAVVLDDMLPNASWSSHWSKELFSPHTPGALSTGVTQHVRQRGIVVAAKVSRQLAAAFQGLLRRAKPADAYVPTWQGFGDCARVTVVVHVRYGDIADLKGPASFGRWIPEAYYARVVPRLVTSVVAAAGGRPVDAHITSQDQRAWAKVEARWKRRLLDAGASSVTLHIDGDPLHSLGHMIHADVLVMGASSFSNIAAFYSRSVLFSWSASQNGVSAPIWMERALPLPQCPRCTCRRMKVNSTVLTDEKQRTYLHTSTYLYKDTNHGCALWCEKGDDMAGARESDGVNVSRLKPMLVEALLVRRCLLSSRWGMSPYIPHSIGGLKQNPRIGSDSESFRLDFRPPPPPSPLPPLHLFPHG